MLIMMRFLLAKQPNLGEDKSDPRLLDTAGDRKPTPEMEATAARPIVSYDRLAVSEIFHAVTCQQVAALLLEVSTSSVS